MGSPSVAWWTAFLARQTAQWRADKIEWKQSVLRCPLVRDDDDDQRGALIARLVVGLVTLAVNLYLFLNSMIDDDGIPYYAIFLTNWTGA